jgi:hypothetical protein
VGEAHRTEAVGGGAWAKFNAEGDSSATRLGQADTGGGSKPCAWFEQENGVQKEVGDGGARCLLQRSQ